MRKYEDNPFEDATVAKEWINSIENERGMIREKELLPLIKKWAEEVRPKVLIDIGMGQGGCADYVQLEGTSYIGVEPSLPLVERAKEKHQKKDREFIVGNAYELPVANGIADAALSINVWFHLRDLDTGSKELSRVLKSGGKFLICTASPDAYEEWDARYDADAKRDGKVIDGRVYVPINPLSRNIFFKHSIEEIMSAFTKNGLVVDKTELNGIFDRSKIPLFINFFGHKK
ncbi:MAG TPA: class I SAM-dependent methyltransferase [Candidatus Paceibacterota bacterium]|nr:class I SAM-dependent methyltransferase [Candidatus Paceibacterota bacterium]